ncbi:flagellar basal body P-ring biosynthesis protein FlgA [Citrobacter freundii]|nr:flagellar basal body P-ring biosynthesis protein FlgA [Citrobacter freundii]
MQTFKRGIVVAALLFSPMTLAQDLNSPADGMVFPASGRI